MSEEASRFKEFERSLVQVLVNGQSSGTGVVVASGWVLTCLHVLIPPAMRNRQKSALTEIDLQNRFSVRFVTLSSERNQCDETIPASSAAHKQGSSSTPGAADTSVKDVQVWPAKLDACNIYDLALLHWDGELPDGVKSAAFCHASSQNATEFHCRGFPGTGEARELLAPGHIIAPVKYKDVDHWQISSDNIQGGHSGAPLYSTNSGRLIGLVRANLSPSEDFRGVKTAFAIMVHSILEFLKQVPELADLVRAGDKAREAHAAAERRLDAEVIRCLKGDEAVLRKVADEFLEPDRRQDPLADVASAIKKVSISELADKCIGIETDFHQSGNKRAAACLRDFYYAVLAQILNPALVEAKRLEMSTTDGQRGVLLLPCPDRAVLELLCAGIDGRAVKFICEKDNEFPRSANELCLDDLPEGGIDGKPNELAEFLTKQLRLERLTRMDPRDLPTRLRLVLQGRRKNHDCVFAVIKGYSAKSRRDHSWEAFQKIVETDYPEILLIDMTQDRSDSVCARYFEAGYPLTMNALLPESSP